MTEPEILRESVYRMAGGPYDPDPKDIKRPGLVGYIPVDIDLDTGAKLTVKWHHLGPAARTPDEVMHRVYLSMMERLVTQDRTHGGRAFYPDEAGVMVAAILESRSLGRPTLRWIGFNARMAYISGGLAIVWLT